MNAKNTAAKSTKSTTKTDEARAQREAKAAKPSAPAAPAKTNGAPKAKVAPAVTAAAAPEAAPKAPKAAPVAPESAPEPTTPGAKRDFTKAYNKKMRELGPARSRAVQFRRFIQRVESLTAKMGGWSFEPAPGKGNVFATVLSSLGDATDALGEAVAMLEQVPGDWRPNARAAGGGSAKAKLAVGDVVDIREKQRAGYDGVLGDADMAGLTVKTIGKGKVVCTTAKGERVILPRGHLVIVTEGDAIEDNDVDGDDDDAS